MHAPTVFTLLLSLMALRSGWASHSPDSARSKNHARHAAVVQEREGTSLDLSERNTTLSKRAQFNNAKFSNFVAGPGACGGNYKDSDFIVALNIPQWDNGGNCFKTITIEYQGRSTQAQIVDQCTGCPDGGLDLTGGLFEFLVPGPDSKDVVGIVYGSWSFGGSDGGDSQSSSTTTTTTSSQSPKTSTTAAPPPQTSTKSSTTAISSTTTSTKSSSSSSASTKATTTTMSTTSSSASSSSSSTPSGSSTSSASASQTQSSLPSASSVSIIEDLTQAVLQLGAVAAAHAARGNQ